MEKGLLAPVTMNRPGARRIRVSPETRDWEQTAEIIARFLDAKAGELP